MSPHWVLESDARTLLPFTPTVIGLKSESLGVKLSVPKSHLEPPFEWPGIHLHHAPCDIEKNPEVLPMKENNENIERCLRDCKGMRISYQPLRDAHLSCCLECGHIFVRYKDNIVYEDYQPTPIVLGFTSKLIEAIKKTIKSTTDR